MDLSAFETAAADDQSGKRHRMSRASSMIGVSSNWQEKLLLRKRADWRSDANRTAREYREQATIDHSARFNRPCHRPIEPDKG